MSNNSHEKNDAVQRLAQVLLASSNEQDCQACLDGLEAYVTAQLAGEDYTAQMPAIAGHLDTCVDCAEMYALIYAARTTEATLPEPATTPMPDFSFLEPDASGPLSPDQLRARRAATRVRDLLTTACERAGSLLRLTFSPDLLDALTTMASTAQPAHAFRTGANQGAPLFELVIDAPIPAVDQLQLTAYPHAQNEDHCTLRIQISLPGRDWPDLAGVTVLVRAGNQEYRATTDPWGEAIVAAIPRAYLPQLQVEIETVPPTSA